MLFVSTLIFAHQKPCPTVGDEIQINYLDGASNVQYKDSSRISMDREGIDFIAQMCWHSTPNYPYMHSLELYADNVIIASTSTLTCSTSSKTCNFSIPPGTLPIKCSYRFYSRALVCLKASDCLVPGKQWKYIVSHPVDYYFYNSTSPYCIPECGHCAKAGSGQTTSDPISVVTGEFFYGKEDIRLQSALPLYFKREYKNVSVPYPADFKSDLGYLWWHNYMARLEAPSYGVRFVNEERKAIYFNPSTSAITDNSIEHMKLEPDTDPGHAYKLTTKEQKVYHFADYSGGIAKLLQITDRNGNSITLNYNIAGKPNLLSEAVDNFNHRITFCYDASDMLYRILGPDAGTNCNSPNAGSYYINYSYDANENLSVVDYVPSTFALVDQINQLCSGNKNGLINLIQVQFSNPNANINQNAFEATANNACGNNAQIILNRISALVGEDIFYEYDASHNMTAVKNSSGYILEGIEYYTGIFADRAKFTYQGTSSEYRNILYYSYIDFSPPPELTNVKALKIRVEPPSPSDILHETNYYVDRGYRATLLAYGTGCESCGGAESFQYEWNNYFATTKKISGNGVVTKYCYDYPEWQADPECLDNYVNCTLQDDPRGNLCEVITDLGGNNRSTTYEYNFTWNAISKIKKQSALSCGVQKETSYGFDANGNILSITETGCKDNTSSYSYTTAYGYNAIGQRTLIDGPRVAPADDTIEYIYYANGEACSGCASDCSGLIKRVEQPATTPIRATEYQCYNSYGDVAIKSEINIPSNVITQYSYDFPHRMASMVEDFGGINAATQYIYDADLNLQSKILPKGNKILYTYVPGSNILQCESNVTLADQLIQKTCYDYDVESNKIREEYQDSTGNVTFFLNYEYDTYKRLKKIHYDEPPYSPTSPLQEFTYDAQGNKISFIDANGNITCYKYDELNRMNEIWKFTSDPQPTDCSICGSDCLKTTYAYDINNNVTSVADANLNITSYSYDDLSRMISFASPDSAPWTFAYDEAGNEISRTDARSITSNKAYDSLNRITSQTFPSEPALNITYVYDSPSSTYSQGQLSSVADSSGQIVYNYNSRGLPASEQKTIMGSAFTNSYQYDLNGNISHIIYPSGRDIEYIHDDADRVIQVKGTYNAVTTIYADTITYVPYGKETSVRFGNNLMLSKTYDGFSDGSKRYRLASQSVSMSVPAIMNYSYAYDDEFYVTAITDNVNPSLSKSFTYNPLGWLQVANGPWGQQIFDYDNNGNRITDNLNSQMTQYSYYAASNKIDYVTGSYNLTFLYDNNGNALGDGVSAFVYNANNRLRLWNGAPGFGTYMTYDYLERRVIRNTHGVTDTYLFFFYDKDNKLIGETFEIESPPWQIHKEYIYLNDIPIAMENLLTNETFYLHADHLGTPVTVTDDTGHLAWHSENYAFGDTLFEQGPYANVVGFMNLRFPGQYYDDGKSNLNYNWNRYYYPKIGRYIRSEPLFAEYSQNHFLYSFNNPANIFDREGLWRLSGNGIYEDFLTAMLELHSQLTLCCILYFKNLGVDIVEWMEPNSEPPRIYLREGKGRKYDFEHKRFVDVCGYAQPRGYPEFIYLYKGCLRDKCDIASNALHEMGHIARRDTRDNEPQKFEDMCYLSSCIHPYRTGR